MRLAIWTLLVIGVVYVLYLVSVPKEEISGDQADVTSDADMVVAIEDGASDVSNVSDQGVEALPVQAAPADQNIAETPAQRTDAQGTDAQGTDAQQQTDAQEMRSDAAAPQACAAFGWSLYHCKPYTCSIPHPTQPNFTVDHVIVGMQEDGSCLHTQTLPLPAAEGQAPASGLITCRYSDSMRHIVARQFGSDAPLSRADKQALSLAFEEECSVSQ